MTKCQYKYATCTWLGFLYSSAVSNAENIVEIDQIKVIYKYICFVDTFSTDGALVLHNHLSVPEIIASSSLADVHSLGCEKYFDFD